jgi:GWxTD domain-containing protein
MSPSRFLLPILLLTLALAAPAAAADGPVASRRAVESRELFARAQKRLAGHTIELRRMAIADLDRAARLAPEDPEIALLLARTLYAAGFVRQAMLQFQHVVELSPSDPVARFGLGQVWRRDWLKYVENASLGRAIAQLEAATSLDTTFVDAWLMLSSLRVEAHLTDAALAAAASAFAADSSRPETRLARASASWRVGDVELANHDFRIAIPLMRPSVRERFEDVAPLVTERDTATYNRLSEPQRREWARRFWLAQDPDLGTPENEAQLEYWARVAQAYFLFYDVKHREWDERGELYVRYGPPDSVVYNPVGTSLTSTVGRNSRFDYPMNVLRWSYSKLGMTVSLQDRVLSEYYLLPVAYDHDPDPRPNPDSLARLDAVETNDSRGVFPTLPPRARPIEVRGEVARFTGERGPRLFAALEAAATPADTLSASFVVIDSAGREVARTSGSLAPSACEADRFRVADFAAELPPGHYLVGLGVRGGARRGAVRGSIDLTRPDSVLALSDVVVTCGAPQVAGPAVRLAPNPMARVPAGSPLTAYFEIYHLHAGADGQSRFRYVYRVLPGERDRRVWIQRALAPRANGPLIEASREETNDGPLRRQFISVPVPSLLTGHYRLEIRVTDLQSGEEAVGEAEFTRPAAGAAAH